MVEEKQEDVKPEEVKLVRLNIACGQNKQEGYIGVDCVKTSCTDVVHNLDIFPWPFPDNYADEILCSHYVEHVVNLIGFMDEIYRIAKKGCKVTVIAPYYSSMRAVQDPTHVRSICEASFLYYNKQWREANKLDHYGIKSDFDFQYGYMLSPEWASRAQEARDFAIKHYINVINDIQVTLTKR